jgi:UDPglucose 6-dehydrogenase
MSNILIVGSGIVGQATGKGLAKVGHRVSYVDVNPMVIARLHAENLDAMTVAEVNWGQVDIVMLTIATPTHKGRIALDHLKSAARDVGLGLRLTNRYITVVVRSTVPPFTTEKIILPILEKASGKQTGQDFGVAMNPEFLRQASAAQDFANPRIIVIGSTDTTSIDVLRKLYLPFDSPVVVCTPTEAEMIKYVSNIYNAVKISYFNEVYAICQKLNIDCDKVAYTVSRSAEGMWNPLYGTKGGVPYGGACLPKDTSAFMGFVRELGLEHRLLEATIEVNTRLANHVAAPNTPDQIDALRRSEQLRPELSVRQNERNGCGNDDASEDPIGLDAIPVDVEFL